jgi:hypothetical protein
LEESVDVFDINTLSEYIMKIKMWLKYFVYIVLILVLLYIRDYIVYQSQSYSKMNFRFNINYIILIAIINMLIGISFGLQYLFNEYKKIGRWKINFPKIILMGIPTFYFSISYFLLYSKNQFINNIIAYPIFRLMHSGSGFITIFQIIFGYIIITSFFKHIKEV